MVSISKALDPDAHHTRFPGSPAHLLFPHSPYQSPIHPHWQLLPRAGAGDGCSVPVGDAPMGALGQGGDRAQRAGSGQHRHSGSRANDTSLFPQKKERRSLRGQEEARSVVPCSGQPRSCCQGPGASAPALQQAPRHHEAETHGCLVCTRFLPSGSEWLARLPWLGSVLVLCRSTSPPRA